LKKILTPDHPSGIMSAFNQTINHKKPNEKTNPTLGKTIGKRIVIFDDILCWLQVSVSKQ
jgi:hypothetical protein